MASTCLRLLGVVLIIAPLMCGPLAAEAHVLLPRWRYIVVMSALGFTTFTADVRGGPPYARRQPAQVPKGARLS
jgi:hypothetical protein